MKLRGAWGHEAPALAEIHAAAFDHAWSAAEIAQLLDGPGGFALLVETDAPLAFILCRAVAGEAEILTLAVDPAARRRGLARALVDAAAGAARMAAEGGVDAATQRARVTSPGGTTQAALETFEAGGFRDLVHDAIAAAARRGAELAAGG